MSTLGGLHYRVRLTFVFALSLSISGLAYQFSFNAVEIDKDGVREFKLQETV